MTRAERNLVAFLCLLVAAFTAEHILIFWLSAHDTRPLVDACPVARK